MTKNILDDPLDDNHDHVTYAEGAFCKYREDKLERMMNPALDFV